jgi:hypothetical protein
MNFIIEDVHFKIEKDGAKKFCFGNSCTKLYLTQFLTKTVFAVLK